MNKINSQKGFVVPLVIAVVVILVVGGIFVAMNNKAVPAPQTTNQPTITVLSPNGGENFVGGNTGVIPVKWAATNVSSKEGINLVIIDSNGINILSSSIIGSQTTIGNQSTYNWTPNLPAGKYKIKAQVCSVVGPIEASCGTVLAEDTSDGVFAVRVVHVSDLKTYTNSQYGLTFQYPQEMVFVQPQANRQSLSANVPASYNLPNSFQRSQDISVDFGVANSVLDCMPTAQTIASLNINGVVFNKYKTIGDCAMDGCSIGNTYKAWHNNACYILSWSAIQANPEKSYDGPNDPRTVSAEKAAQATSQGITSITESILATFKFTNQ